MEHLKKTTEYGLLCAFWISMISCYSAQRTMYTEKNNSASLTLSHYTSLLPTLGLCGFSRAEDVYDITTPRTIGKVPGSELKIHLAGDKNKFTSYAGYIEFLSQNKVFVDLYANENGTPVPLSINGKHKIKVEPNEIYYGPHR